MYSDTQELIALANIFNIKINVFKYGEFGHLWSEIHPDPDMVGSVAELDYQNIVPDMFLYLSDDTHYDLLVKEDSRLAVLGPLAGVVDDNEKQADMSNEWKTVNRKKIKITEPCRRSWC